MEAIKSNKPENIQFQDLFKVLLNRHTSDLESQVSTTSSSDSENEDDNECNIDIQQEKAKIL